MVSADLLKHSAESLISYKMEVIHHLTSSGSNNVVVFCIKNLKADSENVITRDMTFQLEDNGCVIYNFVFHAFLVYNIYKSNKCTNLFKTYNTP
jgi:hypothetical protein